MHSSQCNKLQEKYKKKINHLKNKYSKEREIDKNDNIVPEDLEDYGELSVYKESEYNKVETEEYEVLVIGNVELSEDEKAILKLHNKFSIFEKLKPGGLDVEQEASIAKLCMETRKHKEYQDYTPEEKSEYKEIDSKTRMVFDPKEKVFDNRKRRVTDIRECTRITLAQPPDPEEESRIDVRKRTQKEAYEKFRKKNTNLKGEQKSNLTKAEEKGLKSLQKRINDEEIVVLKADKSSRFVVTTLENYLEMGREHTDKDEEVDWEEVKNMERKINFHTTAWELI